MLCLRTLGVIAVLFAIFFFPGCSGRKSLSSDDVRSEVLSANSYAAETEMFIDYARQGKPTRLFVQGHATQLAEEVKRSKNELDDATPQAGTERAFQECKNELDFLTRELPLIPQLIGNDAALQSKRAEIEISRERLASASSLP